MATICLTLAVLKLDRSNEVKEEQFLNISNILIAFEVSKFVKFIEVKEIQSVNI